MITSVLTGPQYKKVSFALHRLISAWNRERETRRNETILIIDLTSSPADITFSSPAETYDYTPTLASHVMQPEFGLGVCL